MTIPTYWNHTGKHQSAADALLALLPAEGRVAQPYKNKALERFRKAYILYKRLNADRSFRIGAARMFGIDYPSNYRRTYYSTDAAHHYYDTTMYELVDIAMDRIIEAAAVEQNITL